jgi:hypothetical protein
VSDSFVGDWELDPTTCTKLDESTHQQVHDEIGREHVTFRRLGDIQEYEVDFGTTSSVLMGYRCLLEDTNWSPYAVRRVIGHADEALDLPFTLGQVHSLVRIVSVDQRTLYRFERDPVQDLARSVTLQRVAVDGKSYRSVAFGVEGVILKTRDFRRV